MKLKENLITQMRTQITDLEKFIEFLKGKSLWVLSVSNLNRSCLADSANAAAAASEIDKKTLEPYRSSPSKSSQPQTTVNPMKMHSNPTKFSTENQPNFSQTMKKVLVLTQLYTFLLLTCGTRSMQKKANQPTPNMKKDLVAKKHFGYGNISLRINHRCSFRDLRAKLEVAIEKVLNAVRLARTFSRHTDDDEDESSSVPTSDNEEVCSIIYS